MNNMFWEKILLTGKPPKVQSTFRNHKQPFLPSDLGYYDLRDVDIIRKQASLARGYGIDGFAIYYYLFDEKTKALETPVNLMRNNDDIDINYYLCWVNVDWTKSWIGDHKTLLYKQKYTKDTIQELAKDVQSFCGSPIL